VDAHCRKEVALNTFIIKDSSAKMPSSCKGIYRRVAVLEMEPGAPPPSMISERARGVVRIVRIWDKLSVGKTDRCSYRAALAEASALVEALTADQTP
jgi:hypothetical protein